MRFTPQSALDKRLKIENDSEPEFHWKMANWIANEPRLNNQVLTAQNPARVSQTTSCKTRPLLRESVLEEPSPRLFVQRG